MTLSQKTQMTEDVKVASWKIASKRFMAQEIAKICQILQSGNVL
jgi:hypothetical protein